MCDVCVQGYLDKLHEDISKTICVCVVYLCVCVVCVYVVCICGVCVCGVCVCVCVIVGHVSIK